MFRLQNFPELVHHIKSISNIYRITSGGSWIQTLCPFCDDTIRKANITHGHCYISSEFPYFICFRCGENGSLLKYLKYTEFNDNSIINKLKSIASTNIKYGVRASSNKYNKFNANFAVQDYQKYILTQHLNFKQQNPNQYQLFLSYINQRCLHINPINYGLIPSDNSVQFINFNLDNCGSRIISSNPKNRYHNKSNNYYYFQNILNIINHKEIIITEGSFDLINLHNYNNLSNNSFYISAGGVFIDRLILWLITNYLLIGKYKFIIVMDNFNKFEERIINKCNYIVNKYNNQIELIFKHPVIGKDVSDCGFLI